MAVTALARSHKARCRGRLLSVDRVLITPRHSTDAPSIMHDRQRHSIKASFTVYDVHFAVKTALCEIATGFIAVARGRAGDDCACAHKVVKYSAFKIAQGGYETSYRTSHYRNCEKSTCSTDCSNRGNEKKSTYINNSFSQ